MICGDQFLESLSVTTDAYFSKYPFVWGWASWRRAWQHYDLKMARWPQRADTSWLEQWTVDAAEHLYWKGIFQRQHDGEIDTWDYSWIFNCWDQDLLSIHPTTNLVSNIGFGSDATHTTDQSSRLANLPSDTSQQHREWTLPAKISLDPSIESRIFHEVYCTPAPVAPPNTKSRQKKWCQWSTSMKGGSTSGAGWARRTAASPTTRNIRGGRSPGPGLA